MSYLTYNGKLIRSNGKYVIGPETLIAVFSSWANSSWDTFSSSGLNISSAIDAANGIALTNYESFITGDIIEIHYNLTLNSGSLPSLRLYSQINGDIATLNMVVGSNIGQITIPGFGGPNFAIAFRASAIGTNSSCIFNIYKK